MKSELIAIPVFEERVSPLLDVSEKFVIYEIKDGLITQRIIININADSDRMRIQKLKEIGVAVIISGAVSRYLANIIVDTGLRHVPWISKPVDEVINSFLNDTLESVFPAKGSCGGMLRKGKLISDTACCKEEIKNNKKEIL